MNRLDLRAVIGRLFPRSLRFQLLSRSLFVLAGMLVLIGILQYVLMHQFLFRSNAENMRNQIMSMPFDSWERRAGDMDGDFDGGGSNGRAGGITRNSASDSAARGAAVAAAGSAGGGSCTAGCTTGEAALSRGAIGSGDPADRLSDMNPGAKAPGKGMRPRLPKLTDAAFAFIDTNLNYRVLTDYDDDSSETADAAIRLSDATYKEALKTGNWDSSVAKNDKGEELLVVLQPLMGPSGVMGIVQMSQQTAPLYGVLLQQLVIFLSLACFALVLGVLTFLPVLRRTLDPLSRMVHTVEQIDAGNLTVRLTEKQNQVEIDRLAASFNGMLERLENSFEAEKEAREQMRRFVADASHELRTPLTSIHGFLEVLLRGALNNPEQLNRSLKSMHGESERIIKLVQDLLMLAKLDRSPAFEFENGELRELVHEMEPQLHVLAGARQVDIETPDAGKARFDRDKMKQVILNLFHNAVQHTDPAEGRIGVRVTPFARGGATITIEDNGPGIAKEHLPHLFDRFYRVDASRTRKHGGAGLGLSITKSIVDLHGGRIDVESREGEGTSFHVRLPSPAEMPEFEGD